MIATGIGKSRDFLVAYSGDAMIVVGGGAGTLTEMAAAYQADKTIVAVKGTGGMADAWAGKHLDHRQRRLIIGASDPKDAVRKALAELAHYSKRGPAKRAEK